MYTNADKKKAKHLRNKIELKKNNGMDCSGELEEALDLIFAHSDDTYEPEDSTKTFMKEYSIILPNEKNSRLGVLISHAEQLLSKLNYKYAELADLVREIYITTDAIVNEIEHYSEEKHKPDDLPEDNYIGRIGKLLLTKGGGPDNGYYEACAEYVSALMKRLRKSIQEGDIKTMQSINIRLGLQAIQFEQVYYADLKK